MAKVKVLRNNIMSLPVDDLKGKTEFEALRHIKRFGTKLKPIDVVVEGRDSSEDLSDENNNRVKLVVKNGFVIRAAIG
jgi:hypothetical protein